MRRRTKIWLVTGAFLTVLGLALFCVGMNLHRWNFENLFTEPYVDNTYEIKNDFHHISTNAGAADIYFRPSEDGLCKVICHEREKETYDVHVQDGTLSIERFDRRAWYDKLTVLSFDRPSIEIYLPEKEYGNLYVKGSTADVSFCSETAFKAAEVVLSTGGVWGGGLSADTVQITVSTGEIMIDDITADTVSFDISTGVIITDHVTCKNEMQVYVSSGGVLLRDIRCGSFVSSGSTGKITVEDAYIDGKVSIERSTGDVMVWNSDAGEIWIETSTGDVEGTLLSDKVFIAKSDTGRIDVPETVTGGRCEITTDTGDIDIEIAE